MLGDTKNYRFIDTGNAPEFFTSGLHQIQIMGQVARLVFYTLRPTEGELLAEPTLSFVVPMQAVGPLISLLLRTCPETVVPAAVGQGAQPILMQ